MKNLFKLLTSTIFAFMIFAGQANAAGGKDVIGYFTQWGVYGRAFNVSEIPADKLTTVVYSFINPTVVGGQAMCTTTDAYADFDKAS